MIARQNTPDALFCYFVGLTRGMVTIETMTTYSDLKIQAYTLTLSEGMTLPESPYIQLNGVLFEVTSREPGQLKASTTFELMRGTNIQEADLGHQLSLGVLARYESPEYYPYLVHPSANTTARVLSCGIQPGHQYTLQINFVCNDAIPLENDKHLGLNGSTVLAREVRRESGLQYFSIYAGRQTRENTIFNETIQPGTRVNLTAPYEPEPITEYPNGYRSPS
ncbi:MAG TPA: hypothetical protein VFU82_00315 [Gammaproteobacteria bacterium]|nr:hypothetical protein [Gammaproteobacteria bacterium]